MYGLCRRESRLLLTLVSSLKTNISKKPPANRNYCIACAASSQRRVLAAVGSSKPVETIRRHYHESKLTSYVPRDRYMLMEDTRMKDLTIALENRPGALAEMGEALGRAGVSIEGGGAFVVNGQGIGHFLFEDGTAARVALQTAGILVLQEREVLIQRLNQAEPGQLGKISRRMAEAGVNIEILYSDHNHQLILVVDDIAKGRAVSEQWIQEWRQP
jgi:hypothetical protein